MWHGLSPPYGTAVVDRVPPDMDHRGRRWPWATGREFCEFSFEKAVTQL
jgi:hypothetical protein